MPLERSGTPAGLAALQLVLEEEHYRALSSERLLAQYLGERDERAFAALVGRYGRLVMARCRQILTREDLAQEAFQETFTQLVLNGNSVRQRGAVGGWLARTARRRAMNIARRERRQRARELAVPPREFALDASSHATSQDTGRAITHALSVLPERLRLPIELVYVDGMTHAQAADSLGWTKGTVDSYVRRGLERLKPMLTKAGVPSALLGVLGLRLPAEAVPPAWVRLAMSGASRTTIRPTSLLSSWSLPLKGAAAITTVGVASAVGFSVWPAAAPAPIANPTRSPEPVVVESLAEQNLRILQSDVAAKVSEALRPLTADNVAPRSVELDAYDSRVKCIIEGNFRGKIPGAGEKSRLAFYFDSGTRRTFLYLDRLVDGNWKSIDLEKPVILAKVSSLKFEWTMKVAELTAAVKAFDDLPRDPRAEAEVAARREALKTRLKDYVGAWYNNASDKCRVEFVEPLGLTFWRQAETASFWEITEEQVWACEAGSRALPINPDGLLGILGVALMDNGQKVEFAPAGLWVRTPVPTK